MKYIQLKVWAITSNPDKAGILINYREQYLRTVQEFPEGATVDVLRKYFDLNAKLQSAGDNDLLELENAEHELLLTKIKAMKWAFFATEIIELVDAVEKASSVKPLNVVLEEKVQEASATAAM